MKTSAEEKRSSFSRLLQQIMIKAGIKNATLAEVLNYDISYVSKWVTGSVMPSRKNLDRVLNALATLAAEHTSTEVREEMKRTVGVKNDDALREYVITSLRDAYFETIGESSESRYIHNATLWVNPRNQNQLTGDLAARLNPEEKLEIVSMLDLFNLDRNTRLNMAGIRDRHFRLQEEKTGIKMDYLVNLNALNGSSVYDMILLIQMMAGFSRLNFHLYHDSGAAGKLLIAVREKFACLTMLNHEGRALSTTVVRDSVRSAEVYDMLCNQISPDHLVFISTEMSHMLLHREYFRNLLSQNIRWLVGHITEHFLPEDLFAALLDRCFRDDPQAAAEAERAHRLTRGVLRQGRVRIMLYWLCMADFIISGELDFFNQKVILEPEQRYQVLWNIRDIVQQMEPTQIKLVREGFSEDFKYISNPCMFLSETASYLRLENARYRDNLLLIKEDIAREKFDIFFESIWDLRSDAVICSHEIILGKLDGLLETASLLMRKM